MRNRSKDLLSYIATAVGKRSASRSQSSDGEALFCERATSRLRWQRDQLPDTVHELVLDDQRRRNDICWSVFDV